MVNPDIDRDNLEISFSCASAYPYERYDWQLEREFIERLVISDRAIDMTRLNGGASVLKNHDTNIVLGKILRAWVQDGALCVRIKFRSDNMSRSLFDDLAAGTIPNVSIGYTYRREDCTEYTDREGNLVREVNRWMAYEVSVCVGIPADPTVGFYRSFEHNNINQHTINITKKGGQTPMEKRAEDTGAEMTAEEMKSRLAELEAENAELKAARAADDGEDDGDAGDGEDGKKECGGENETRSVLAQIHRKLDDICKDGAPARRSLVRPAIHTARREYNMTNVLMALCGRRNIDIGMEREISDELYRSSGQVPDTENSIMIPFNGDSLRGILSTREMNDTVGSASGLVAQENKPDLFVKYITTRIGVKGAKFLTGLTGAPVTIPAQTSNTSVAWVTGSTMSPATTDANAAVPETEFVAGNVTLTPHKLGAYVDVGRDLILMGNPSATAIATESMFGNIARVLGTTMLKGNASNPAITGVATATGVQTQVIANMASATWANFTSMIGKIEGLEWNGPQEFVMSASDNALLKAIPKGNYGSGFIVEDGYLDGRRVYVDGSLSAGDIFLGDWSNIVVGQWGGIELLVDPFTQGINGTVRLIVHLVCDINVLRPNTFVMRVAA